MLSGAKHLQFLDDLGGFEGRYFASLSTTKFNLGHKNSRPKVAIHFRFIENSEDASSGQKT